MAVKGSLWSKEQVRLPLFIEDDLKYELGPGVLLHMTILSYYWSV
jgi:hypothetical protein